MKSIYSYDSYKDYLKDYIEAYRRPGLVSELAKSAGCDRTYFSQSLTSKVQLTPDHAISLSEGLGLNEAEQNYFLTLVLHNRASNTKAQLHLRKRLDKLVKEQAVLSKKIKSSQDSEEISETLKTKYYSSWLYGAVHILTSIPEYQTVAALCQKLEIQKEICEEILSSLGQMNLTQKHGDRYKHAGGNIHISIGSAINSMNHLNWRLLASQRANKEDDVHYTTAFSISKKDMPVLKTDILDFIKSQRKIVHNSGTEQAFAFCLDFFEI